jgi:hypothetical protein
MRIKTRGVFFFALCCLLNCVLLKNASANSIVDDWATLPANRSGAKCKIEHFSAPWPKHLSLGENGFLMAGISSFGQNQVFQIRPSGSCTFVFCEYSPSSAPPKWRQVSFKISNEELERLVLDIERANVRNLEMSYDYPDLSDGEQAFFSISDGSNLRTVRMNNFFPDEYQNIIRSIAHLIKAQHLQLDLAPISNPAAGHALYLKAFPKP